MDTFMEFPEVKIGQRNDSTLTCENLNVLFPEERARLPKIVEGILLGGNILIVIFSICGNIAALIIIVRSKAPKLSTKYFLIFLGVSDLLMTLTAPPVAVAKMLTEHGSWVFGRTLCKLIPCLQLVAATMSAICLMAIAFERNLLIVLAMKSSTTFTAAKWEKWVAPIIYVLVIIAPIACGIPFFWYYEHTSYVAARKPWGGIDGPTTTTTTTTETTTPISTSPLSVINDTEDATGTTITDPCKVYYSCGRTSFDRKNVTHFSIIGVHYFCLLVCFLVCYISIYRFVKKHGNFRKELDRQPQNRQNFHNNNDMSQDNKLFKAERHRKTLRLILGLILLNLCCRLPNWLFMVIINVVVVPITSATLSLLECLQFLSSLNSALNPFVYVIWNHSLRATSDRDGPTRRRGLRCCWKTSNNWLVPISSCCQRTYDDDDSNPSEMPSDPVAKSSWWPWKSPRVYNIQKVHENNIVPSISTQRVFYSDKS